MAEEEQKEPPELTSENWNEFVEKYGIFTNSLWLIGARDSSGGHKDLHHGGFIPQLPRQGILRFTRPRELVLDAFLGYGTTLIECKRWGRSGIGVEVSHELAELATKRVNEEPNPYGVSVKIVEGDSTQMDFESLVRGAGFETASLVVLHPPYHDIIKYNGDPRNLCNAPDLGSFTQMYRKVVERSTSPLKPRGYLELVIGDKYQAGEWIPLSFYLMQATMEMGFKLKSVCIKNITETMAKKNQTNLWKYRTLKWGTHFFKHEYILFFEKSG
jgi:tRNA1(Val) A37 N6-methylase TrmN6